MKRLYLFLPIILLVYWNCEEPKEEEEDTTPPTVTITSPQNSSTVYEIVNITCISTDNEEVNQVELWVNGFTTGLIDTIVPYSFDWNTIEIEDGSYTIFVRSYDISGNMMDSNPINLIVDNSGSYPTPVELFAIIYMNNLFFLSWSQNNDDDFKKYKLYESIFENLSDSTLIYEADYRTDTTHSVYMLSIDEKRYYSITVEDIYGFQSSSNIEVGNSETLFIKTFGGSDTEIGNDIMQTNDGGFIITGYTESYGNGYSDLWLIKTDPLGNEEWSKTFGGIYWDVGNKVQQTFDTGFIIVGYTLSSGNGGYDVWLIKTDPQGNEEWNKTYGGSGHEQGFSLQQTLDGGYIITGYTESFGNGSSDLWLIKTDSQGSEEWNKTFGTVGNDGGLDIEKTADGGYLISGYKRSLESPRTNAWLIKTDSQGNEEWNQTYEDDGFAKGYSVKQTLDGGYILTGEVIVSGLNHTDCFLLKTDSQGNVEWDRTFGWDDFEGGFSVKQTIEGGYIVSGYTTFGTSGQNIWLIKTDSQGNVEWNKTFGGNNNEKGFDIEEINNGKFVVIGFTNSFGIGNKDIWLIKTDSEGNTVDYP